MYVLHKKALLIPSVEKAMFFELSAIKNIAQLTEKVQLKYTNIVDIVILTFPMENSFVEFIEV